MDCIVSGIITYPSLSLFKPAGYALLVLGAHDQSHLNIIFIETAPKIKKGELRTRTFYISLSVSRADIRQLNIVS